MKKAKQLNIAHVAKAAGVSTTTVSRVLNGVASVSENNRQKVREAMKQLKYRPNPNAQRLASGKAKPTIGLVIPRFEGIFHSYYALEVIKGIGMAAERLRCDLFLHITDGKTLPLRPAVQGIVFIDIYGCEDILDQTLQEGVPTTVLSHYLEDLPVNCVAVDNRTGAEKAVDYLVRLGHRDIGTITGDLKVQAGLDRFDGFMKAMKARQLAVQETHIRFGDFGLPSARSATEALLALKDRPTALFVGSDEMALEVVNVALTKGVRVPEELSVIGFDDNPIAAHGRVPLTTIRQPLSEMGRMGLELLVQEMSGKRKAVRKLLLPTELIERQSVRQTWLER